MHGPTQEFVEKSSPYHSCSINKATPQNVWLTTKVIISAKNMVDLQRSKLPQHIVTQTKLPSLYYDFETSPCG